MSINIALPTKGGTKNAVVPLPVGGIVPLREAVKQCLEHELPSQTFTLTDTLKDITNDEDVAQLLDGATLVVTNVKDGQLAAPARERISFQPHPKTLTMAGDYEYFAAQGRHPFVYALAEFIDNSLRATRNNAPNPRNVNISLLTTGTGAARKGLVCIQDNGCGMTKHELNDWAVMNYSMEERGVQPQEPEAEGRGRAPAPAAGRFLTGDLSFFGVGSKNAAFFMGASVKVATRKAGERFVHELSLDAANLESRYRNHEAVYEEDMVHRNPGDVSTLSKMESPFNAAVTNWIQEEMMQPEEDQNEAFTRVIIGDLKADILEQLADDAGGAQICRKLAHVYHYYLHGEAGNRVREEGTECPIVLPNGEPLPNIMLRHTLDSRILWERKLTEVEDDLETRLLRAHKSEFNFTLEVPEKGIVNGVLYYFPYENDRETVPIEAEPSWAAAAVRPNGAGSTQIGMYTQAGGANGRTQAAAGGGTQFGRTTQAVGGAGGSREVSQDDLSDDEDTNGLPHRSSIFSAFWQGRLIPSAQIDPPPFLDAIRQKRTSASKDSLPDEVFGRLRGALFFGPGFRVTRNKQVLLLFRDNLPEVLSTAVPGDRNIEKRFKDWLSRCHSTLDKSFRFLNPINSREQAALRAQLGEGITAFERISDGNRTISAGDVVRFSAKPAIVGRVVYFTVPQAVRDEGAYSNGRVHVEPLPKGIHGSNGPAKNFNLRRLDAVLTEKETEDHCSREMAKLPMSLRVEPMRFATGQVVEMVAGDDVPETSIAVLNGGGQKLVRAFYNGEKQALMVTQKLWRLPHEGAALPSGAAGESENVEKENAESESAERPAKRSRKGRKGKKQQVEETAAAAEAPGKSSAGADNSSSSAELIVSVENKAPNKDSFVFSRISDGLKRAGHFVLEYFITPVVEGQTPLRCTVPLVVSPGAATCLKIAGEGVVSIASRTIVLGETMPPFTLLFSDEYGNEVAMPKTAEASIKVQAMVLGSDGETLEKCKGLQVSGDMEPGESSVTLRDLRFIGSKKAVAAGAGLPVFLKQAEELASGGAGGGQRGASQNAITPVTVHACFSVAGSSMESEHVEVQLHPGAPHDLKLLPGGFWEQEAATATVQSGAEIPEFTVKAIDACGNPTAPTEKMQFSLVVESDALLDSPSTFSFDATGLATVSGLRAATRRSGTSTVTLSLQCNAASESLQAAIALAQPTKELALTMEVLPSALPAFAQILVNGEALPMEDRPDDDGNMVPTAVLSGIEAGYSQGSIRLMLLDESGAPAALPVTGKVHVSWHSGAKKITWKGEPIKLPSLRAPELVSEPMVGFIRFTGDASNPMTIECFVDLAPVPGPPNTWSVTLVDQVNSQSPEQQGFVVSGQPFAVEIEALDKYTNRCAGGAATIPAPEIILESTMPLEYNSEEWERGWIAQGSEEVYNVRMTVGGHPGEVKIKVCDSAASDKSSLLLEDCLTIDLRAGPPAALAFKGAASMECGTRAVLGNVEVVLRDAAGYPTKATETFEITLAGSALAADGSGRAAKVVANNANKAKITKSKSSAVFKGVTITAEASGTYALRVQSASRKVALQEGVLQLVMAPLSAVTGLEVIVPAELGEGGQLGVTNRLLVAVETENGELLPDDAAVAGLTLKITPPNGNRNDSIVCTFPAAEDGESLPVENGCYSFALSELTLAGNWTAAAEYAEPRADVRAALGKKADIRSSAVQFTILPGPPVTAAVKARQLPDRATVTNAAAAKARLLVLNAAAQVQDAYGNVAEAVGVQLRFRLRAAAANSMPPGSVIPTLEAEEGLEPPKDLDDRGRAYFGRLSIVEGSGAAPVGPLELELICEALGLYPSSNVELEIDEEGWTVCWKCPVLFSDNTAQFGAIEKLNEQRGALLERREDIQRRLDDAQHAVSVAEKQEKRAAQAAEAVQRRVAGDLPASAKAAERQLKKLEKSAEAAGGEQEESRRDARWGPQKSPLTASIDVALRANTGGLIGVFAQLITIDDDRLATVASAALRPTLGVIVVENNTSRTNLAAALTAKKYPIPDVLPLTQVNTYRGPKQGEMPGFSAAGELAKVLTRSACAGIDRALCLPLPHQKSNNSNNNKKDGAGGSSSMNWPQGCLGYLCNLVRPVHTGHRATIIYGLLSGTLIFETLNDATAYREYVTQTMKMPFGNEMLCLDGGRVTGRGIISGSNFRPPPLDKADFVIGSGEGAPGGGSADKIQGLQSWIQVLQDKEAAEASVAAAQKKIDDVARACRPDLDVVDGELADVDAQIAQLQTTFDGARSHQKQQKSGKQQRKRQHEEEEVAVEIEEVEEEVVEPVVEPKARTKRKRLVKGG